MDWRLTTVAEEYTPTTAEVRARWLRSRQDNPQAAALANAEFERWLGQIKSAAWKEGHTRALANIAWPKESKGNPYEEDDRA